MKNNIMIYIRQQKRCIHWIAPILQSHPNRRVLFFKWKDERGICKDHYWYRDKSFMVVLREFKDKYKIVSSFCVDGEENQKFYERYVNYNEGRSGCL